MSRGRGRCRRPVVGLDAVLDGRTRRDFAWPSRLRFGAAAGLAGLPAVQIPQQPVDVRCGERLLRLIGRTKVGRAVAGRVTDRQRPARLLSGGMDRGGEVVVDGGHDGSVRADSCPTSCPIARRAARSSCPLAPVSCPLLPGSCPQVRGAVVVAAGVTLLTRHRSAIRARRRRRPGRRAGRRCGFRSAGAVGWIGLRCRCRR